MYAVPVLIITVNWGSTVWKSTTCNWLFSNNPYYTLFAPQILHNLLSLNALWKMQYKYSQEHLKTMVYAKFGGANRVFYGGFENNRIYNVHARKRKKSCVKFQLPVILNLNCFWIQCILFNTCTHCTLYIGQFDFRLILI